MSEPKQDLAMEIAEIVLEELAERAEVCWGNSTYEVVASLIRLKLTELEAQNVSLLAENLAFQREWDAFALHRRRTLEAEAELRKRKEEANGAAS